MNHALRLKADHDRRLRRIDDLFACCEAEHGEITERETEAAAGFPRPRATVGCGGRVIDDNGAGISSR